MLQSFGKNNDFDLRLPGINGKTPLGNCDLCFLKGKNTIMNIMKNYPEKSTMVDGSREEAAGR